MDVWLCVTRIEVHRCLFTGQPVGTEVGRWKMKLCLTLGFLLAALGGATELESNDPPINGSTEVESDALPNLEGLNPSQIEKIMIEELIDKPKKGKKGKGSKAPVTFEATVRPILKQFKKQLLEDKKKMQKQLYDDIAVIKKCITKMKKSVKLGLVEVEVSKKKKKKAAKAAKAKKPAKKKCPTKKDVKKCKDKIKNLKPKQKACDDLQKIGDKDVKSIHELIKKWNKQKIAKKDCVQDKGETKYHYVSRLAKHFKTKLASVKKRVDEMVKKKAGGKVLDKGCNAIKHYARHLIEHTCKKVSVANYGCQCAKVIKEGKICGMFNGCYSASVLQYKNNKKEIEIKNAAAKLEWRAVGRIECLLKVMSGKNKADAKQLEKCVKGPQISTKPLDLIYPRIPAKPKCALKGVKPDVRKRCVKGAPIKKKKVQKPKKR